MPILDLLGAAPEWAQYMSHDTQDGLLSEDAANLASFLASSFMDACQASPLTQSALRKNLAPKSFKTKKEEKD